MLTVTGIFKQKTRGTSENLRSFQKTMVIVPSGTGFCIKNEMLHINNVTMAQVKTAFKPIAAAAPTPVQVIYFNKHLRKYFLLIKYLSYRIKLQLLLHQ